MLYATLREEERTVLCHYILQWEKEITSLLSSNSHIKVTLLCTCPLANGDHVTCLQKRLVIYTSPQGCGSQAVINYELEIQLWAWNSKEDHSEHISPILLELQLASAEDHGYSIRTVMSAKHTYSSEVEYENKGKAGDILSWLRCTQAYSCAVTAYEKKRRRKCNHEDSATRIASSGDEMFRTT